MASKKETLKKKLLFAAFAVLTVVFCAACDTGSGGTNGPGNTGSKPTILANTATYSQAIAKLDEIIAYCNSHNPDANHVAKTNAEAWKLNTMPQYQSQWSQPHIATTNVSMINAIIAQLK